MLKTEATTTLKFFENVYAEGVGGWVYEAKINALDMLLKQSFCGGGMLQTTRDAFAKAKSKVSLMAVMISHLFSDGIQACFVVVLDTSEDWLVEKMWS